MKKAAKIEKKEEKRELKDIRFVLNEMGTPLDVMNDAVGFLVDLENEAPDAKKIELLDVLRKNLDKLRVFIASLAATAREFGEHGVNEKIYFGVMNHIQQVCATHDILFLQKQLHYHISASADLPKVYANPEQILLVISNLVSNAIKYAPRGSDIEINIKEVSLRQGAGIEITVVNANEEFTERDRYHIFEKFYKDKTTDARGSEGLGLSVCREIVQQSHGQLWVDIPQKGKVAFAFVLPCAEIDGDAAKATHQTYKYDITIANYDDIKSRHGNEKSYHLLTQVEEYVRNLVRYPVDVVTVFEQSGIISTIYETEEGHASSVAARISQKLGSEQFRIGKSQINVTFQYRLSTLQ